jgi:hypothetical protein
MHSWLDMPHVYRESPCVAFIPFPAAPTLLPSARDLVAVDLRDIPNTGYISPEAMVASLAALPKLEYLAFGFRWGTSYPDRIGQPPITQTVLPFLTPFVFDGLLEYLEDFVAQIDTPQLKCFQIKYLDEDPSGGVDVEIPQLCKFIDRSETFSQFRCAELDIQHDTELDIQYDIVILELDGDRFRLTIPDGWISQVLNQISGMLSSVDRLDITSWSWKYHGRYRYLGDYIQWLELLRPFAAVKALGVQEKLTEHFVYALRLWGVKVLPALELLCLDGMQVTSVGEEFVAFRRSLGHPVTFVNRREFRERLGLDVSDYY